MDAHERAAALTRLDSIEKKIQHLPECGISPAQQAKRGLALQGEWTPVSNHRPAHRRFFGALMLNCKKCDVPMHKLTAPLSRQAIQLLKRREGNQESVASPEWRDGPLCDKCLAAWSALIGEMGR